MDNSLEPLALSIHEACASQDAHFPGRPKNVGQAPLSIASQTGARLENLYIRSNSAQCSLVDPNCLALGACRRRSSGEGGANA
jgi:hypothetical protein